MQLETPLNNFILLTLETKVYLPLHTGQGDGFKLYASILASNSLDHLMKEQVTYSRKSYISVFSWVFYLHTLTKHMIQ